MIFSISTNTEAALQYRSAPAKGTERLAIAVVLVLHIIATCILLPPWEALHQEPLLYADHPVHTHRVYMYRQGLFQSSFPWGLDPAVSAGVVMDPTQDLGAHPQEVLAVLLPFLSPGTVVKLFLFLSALTMPLWILLTCRRFGIPLCVQVWVMVTLLAPAWLYDNFVGYFRWGMAAFAAASYFSPYVIALFLNFLARPGLRIYMAFFFAGVVLFLLHGQGPWAIIPPLVLYTLMARPLPRRWRTAALLAPLGILMLNAFWVFPFILATGMPQPPWPPIQALFRSPDMTYATWSELVEALSPIRITAALCGLSLAAYGCFALRRFVSSRVVISFALAAAFALFLKFFGSFLPIVSQLQPARFILPGFVLLTLPVGTALFTIAGKVRLPAGLSATVLALFLATMAFFLGKPERLPLPPSPDLLGDFVNHRTAPTDRLLIQTRLQSEPKVMALAFGREVVGNTYPKRYDPAQFRNKVLWGKELDSWSSRELRSALKRWGIAWVFSCTEEARALFAEAISSPGEAVGKYHAFQVPDSPTRFLVGKGSVKAKVNRLELTELVPENGLVVLRYRYHPAWQTTSGLTVQQYPVLEDPSGFIALRSPPHTVILRFDPLAMLRAPWPQQTLRRLPDN